LGSIGPPHSHTSFLFGCIGGPAEGNNNHAFQQPDPTTRTWGQTIGRTRRPEDLSLSKRKRRPEDLSLKKKKGDRRKTRTVAVPCFALLPPHCKRRQVCLCSPTGHSSFPPRTPSPPSFAGLRAGRVRGGTTTRGDGVPRQAGARAHGPRGNSSRPELLPRIRCLELLTSPHMTSDLSFSLELLDL
jgi:hypothetical protein